MTMCTVLQLLQKQGLVCTMRGFHALWISVSKEERNHAFLPLPWKIEILYIKENQFIFFPFPQGKCVTPDNKILGCIENQNNFSLNHRILWSQGECRWKMSKWTIYTETLQQITFMAYATNFIKENAIFIMENCNSYLGHLNYNCFIWVIKVHFMRLRDRLRNRIYNLHPVNTSVCTCFI